MYFGDGDDPAVAGEADVGPREPPTTATSAVAYRSTSPSPPSTLPLVQQSLTSSDILRPRDGKERARLDASAIRKEFKPREEALVDEMTHNVTTPDAMIAFPPLHAQTLVAEPESARLSSYLEVMKTSTNANANNILIKRVKSMGDEISVAANQLAASDATHSMHSVSAASMSSSMHSNGAMGGGGGGGGSMSPAPPQGAMFGDETIGGTGDPRRHPWPHPFPNFEGCLFSVVNSDKWGHGQETFESVYTDWEAHPNIFLYADLFRAKFSGQTIEIPADATATAHERVGVKHVQRRYFLVDKITKGLRMLGGVDLPDESDDTKLKPNGGYFNDLPLSNDFGGWQWHINVKQSIELELNDDNSVLSAVDFKARSVVESGDPTALMAFHFAQERAALGITSHALGSDSRPSGSMGGQQGSSEPDQKLLELQEVFRPENIFRNPRDPYPKIEFSIRFKTITSVEPDSEIFGANVEMVLSWQITKQDAANFIACVNRAAWKPASFEPPELAVVNPALGRQDQEVKINEGLTHIVVAPDRRVIAVRPITITGEFYQHYDFVAYPFDHQLLKINLKSKLPCTDADVMFDHKTPQSKSKLQHPADKSAMLPEIRDTEWEAQDVASWHHFVPDLTIEDDAGPEADRKSKGELPRMSVFGGRGSDMSVHSVGAKGSPSDRTLRGSNSSHIGEILRSIELDEQGVSHIGSHSITVQVEVQRKYLVHMFRVVLVMMLISLSANTAMLPDDGSSSIERIGVLITLMLTAATYSQVIASSLPTVGYLSLLDLYILATFIYLFLLLAEVAVLDYGWASPLANVTKWFEDGEEVDPNTDTTYLITYANLAFWLAYHIALALYSRHVVKENRFTRQNERTKSLHTPGKANLGWSHLSDSANISGGHWTPDGGDAAGSMQTGSLRSKMSTVRGQSVAVTGTRSSSAGPAHMTSRVPRASSPGSSTPASSFGSNSPQSRIRRFKSRIAPNGNPGLKRKPGPTSNAAPRTGPAPMASRQQQPREHRPTPIAEE